MAILIATTGTVIDSRTGDGQRWREEYIAWQSSAGSVFEVLLPPLFGALVQVDMWPDAVAAPTTLYDLECLVDCGGVTLDAFGGQGANRSATVAETFRLLSDGQHMPFYFTGEQPRLKASAAGASKKAYIRMKIKDK